MKSKCCHDEVVTKHGCDQDLGHGGKKCDCEKKGWTITFWNECSKCNKPCDIFQPLTHEEKLTAVQEKVVECCPDLKNVKAECLDCGCPASHDPRLEHVLRALDKNIGLWQWHPTYKPITVIEALLRDANWELEKELSGQSEPTIDFLFDVFYKK